MSWDHGFGFAFVRFEDTLYSTLEVHSFYRPSLDLYEMDLISSAPAFLWYVVALCHATRWRLLVLNTRTFLCHLSQHVTSATWNLSASAFTIAVQPVLAASRSAPFVLFCSFTTISRRLCWCWPTHTVIWWIWWSANPARSTCWIFWFASAADVRHCPRPMTTQQTFSPRSMTWLVPSSEKVAKRSTRFDNSVAASSRSGTSRQQRRASCSYPLANHKRPASYVHLGEVPTSTIRADEGLRA